MYRDIRASGRHVREIVVQTPVGDYELLDFGRGRKLERFAGLVLERPDERAQGEPVLDHWQADWVFGVGTGQRSGWQPARPGLVREWEISVDGLRIPICLGERGRIGFHPRDLACRRWIQERMAGVYDLDELRLLNLFGGEGVLSGAGLQAGADVIHVDADAARLEIAQRCCDRMQTEFCCEHVPNFVERAQRRGDTFEFIAISPPRVGRAPSGDGWDIEVDLANLIRNLRELVSEHVRGIWVHADTGSWSAASIAEMLHSALPGRKQEALSIGLTTADGRVLPAGGAARWFDERELFVPGAAPPLDTAEIEEHLDVYLDAVLSSRRTATAPASALSGLDRGQQDFVLHWTRVIARTNAEMAYQFAQHAGEACAHMDEPTVEAWLIRAMDTYDTQGLLAGASCLQKVDEFAREAGARAAGLTLDEVATVLEVFVHGLNGRKLKIEESDECYTDTSTLFLPAILSHFPTRDENFRLYKVIVAHLWAQTWFGTWREPIAESMQAFDQPERALRHFNVLECIRLDACIERALPGLYRDLLAIREREQSAQYDRKFEPLLASLRHPLARVTDTLAAVERVIDEPVPIAARYQGVLYPDRVAELRQQRLQLDRDALRIGLLRMQEDVRRRLQEARDEAEPEEAQEPQPKLKLRKQTSDDQLEMFRYEITLEDKPVAPPDNVKGTMQSILQDLGEIPDDYLVAAGDGAYYADVVAQEEQKAGDVWKGVYHEEGAFQYNEWDHERKHYRKNWAVLRELDVHPQHDTFCADTLHKYKGLVGELRRTFEALRGEDKLLKKQSIGDDVDIDALVEAYADVRTGLEMSDRLFTKMQKHERDIAVMLMVDMSGSTKGWINDAEREALLLLCESLETLGDRYAMYGFSGMTRKRCEVYRIKRFEDPFDDEVRARISGIKPKDYTRMGVAIRHLTHLLGKVEARTKLLVTLSDGKPDDYDTYRGAYGIEDTRMALIEAKREGIHPFCITIDTEAHDYLSHMYGAVNYTIVDEVRKLPLKVSDIYRRLTT